MTPERYRQIGEIYHAVLEVEHEKRGAFLDRSCAGDEVLRSEVESLIASHEQASDFIETPALAVAAGMLSRRDSLVGQKIANFDVLSLIGEGGMGEVYLAEDTRLGRRVALKLLSPAFTSDADRMRRFVQEARAASALNHPNILTVHEIGRANDFDFIATEFIEGETLRSSMAQRRLPLTQALDVAAQVAGALAAAHAAGVVHRDIKPENIMLRPDGYVKVLDFGLAKLAGQGFETGNEASTVVRVETNPGVVMGTVQYMSPEQTRGRTIDARTDVWSLGVVLYEMIAHRPPFEGETQSDTIVSILEREPKPLALYAPEAPAELERIVTKALAKDKEERYQTAKDMAIDLLGLRRRLDVQVEIERFSHSEGSGETGAVKADPVLLASAQEQNVTRTELVEAAATSSLEFAVTEIRRHKMGVALAALFCVAALLGGGYVLFRLLSRNGSKETAPFQAMKITRLTSDGTASAAAISADGRYVAYVLSNEGRQTLRMRQVATGSDLQVVPPAEGVCIGLTFSPNGDYLYYVTLQGRGASRPLLESDAPGTLYQVPVLGGASRRLMTHVDSPVTFSPDGTKFAFVRASPDRGETALMVANADGSAEQRLAARTPPDVYLSKGRVGSGPAWSPDGKVIACGVGRFAKQQVVSVSAADGSEKPVGEQSWQFVGRLSWLPDGSGLVMMATDQRLSSQLWQLSYPAGEVRRITNDLNNYSDVSLESDASSLVTVQTDATTQYLWVVALGEASDSAKKIVSASGTGEVSWTPDGRLVYDARADGITNLWVANQDGTDQQQLTAFTNSINVRPNVSPDGRHIVFVSDRAGPRNIWRVDIDGTNPVRLTSGDIETWPTYSPDGHWVVYSTRVSGKHSLWKVTVDGGDPIQLTSNNFSISSSSVSPDGKLVVYSDRGERTDSTARLVVVRFDGGASVKTFDLPPTVNLSTHARWSPDGRSLTYVDTRDGVSNVWSQPFEGGAPRKLTDFKSDGIFTFDWSRDGKQLALWRGRATRNVVLISDFR
jgi:serine/threonine protein kinase/Tol biopolymer transport system component